MYQTVCTYTLAAALVFLTWHYISPQLKSPKAKLFVLVVLRRAESYTTQQDRDSLWQARGVCTCRERPVRRARESLSSHKKKLGREGGVEWEQGADAAEFDKNKCITGSVALLVYSTPAVSRGAWETRLPGGFASSLTSPHRLAPRRSIFFSSLFCTVLGTTLLLGVVLGTSKAGKSNEQRIVSLSPRSCFLSYFSSLFSVPKFCLLVLRLRQWLPVQASLDRRFLGGQVLLPPPFRCELGSAHWCSPFAAD